MGIEGMYVNIVKVIYDKLIVNIILKDGKLKAFHQDQKQEKDAQSHHFQYMCCQSEHQSHHFYSTLYWTEATQQQQQHTGSPSQKIQAKKKKEKKEKALVSKKEEAKLSLIANDMKLYIENTKNNHQKKNHEFNKLT